MVWPPVLDAYEELFAKDLSDPPVDESSFAVGNSLASAWDEDPVDWCPETTSEMLSPKSPVLVTPEMDESGFPQVNDVRRTPSKYKGKEKSVSPPSPPQTRAVSPSKDAASQQVFNGPKMNNDSESLDSREAAELEMAILASLQESPSHLRINDDYVEGESPAGPSNARPNDDDAMDIDDDRAMHGVNHQVRQVRTTSFTATRCDTWLTG
jgi:hypothetical protein